MYLMDTITGTFLLGGGPVEESRHGWLGRKSRRASRQEGTTS